MEKTPPTQLFNKNFTLMALGEIISIFGSAMLRFALSTYALDITGRADIFATLFALSTIPGIIISPIGGAIADRFNRKWLMVIFDVISGIIILGLAIFLLNGGTSIVVIGIIMALLSMISAMYQPTAQASIPLLVKVDDMEKANGIITGVGAISSITGLVLGGILYAVIGLNALVIASCIAFFLSAFMETYINMPFTKRTQTSGILPTIMQDLREGTRYITHNNTYILKSIIIAAGLNLFLTPFFIVGAPYIFRITMNSNDTIYGVALGLIQVSSILGALTISSFTKRITMKTLYRSLLAIAFLIIPLALGITPIILNYGNTFALFIFFLSGIPIIMLMTMISIYVITIIQKQTPNELLGKVMAIIIGVSQCVAPIGQIVYGMLFEHFSTQPYLPTVAISIAMIVLGLITKKLFQNVEVTAQ